MVLTWVHLAPACQEPGRIENPRSDGLRLVLDGLQESPLLHDPSMERTRRAIVALIRSALRA
jgi:hypothetical protein